MGSIWRTETSVRQSIVPDPETVVIQSDNIDALVTRYEQLTTDPERVRFVDALLSRLRRDTEYAPVGYVVVMALFRLHRLADVLDKAATDLQGDAGFGEVLRLVDGLLRLCHPSFADADLDAVERFAHPIQDPMATSIRQRVAAIRAYRVGRPSQQDSRTT